MRDLQDRGDDERASLPRHESDQVSQIPATKKKVSQMQPSKSYESLTLK